MVVVYSLETEIYEYFWIQTVWNQKRLDNLCLNIDWRKILKMRGLICFVTPIKVYIFENHKDTLRTIIQMSKVISILKRYIKFVIRKQLICTPFIEENQTPSKILQTITVNYLSLGIKITSS